MVNDLVLIILSEFEQTNFYNPLLHLLLNIVPGGEVQVKKFINSLEFA